MRAARHPLVVGLERQSKPVIGNAHIAGRAARYRVRRHGPHLLRHHPDIGGVAAVVDEAIIAETVVEPPEEHDIVLEAHVGATRAAATPAATEAAPATPAATEAAPAAAAAAEAAAAAAAEAALHSPAAERAAIGEGRVGPAHPDAAHRRASRPAHAGPRCGTVSGPRRGAGATAGSACTAWPACTADATWPACTADATWPAGAASPTWPADAAGTACATDATGSPDAADAARTARPPNAAWPPGSAGAAGAIGADPRLAAHTGPIVPVRPPGLHVVANVAEVDVIADIDVAVIDGAIPARIARPDRRVDRACSPIPIIVIPQRPDCDARPEA